MLSIETLLVIHVVSLLIERQPILKIKYKIYFFNLSLHNDDSCHFISFSLHEGCHIDLDLALTLRDCDLKYFIPYDQIPLLIAK
jgi:hypothetical protein